MKVNAITAVNTVDFEVPFKTVDSDVRLFEHNADFGRSSELLSVYRAGPVHFTAINARHVSGGPNPHVATLRPKIANEWYPNGGWPGDGPLIADEVTRSRYIPELKKMDPGAAEAVLSAGLDALTWLPVLGAVIGGPKVVSKVGPVLVNSGAGQGNMRQAYTFVDEALTHANVVKRNERTGTRYRWVREYLLADPMTKARVGQRLVQQKAQSKTMMKKVGARIAALATQSQNTRRYLQNIEGAARSANALAQRLPKESDRFQIGLRLMSALEQDANLPLGTPPTLIAGRLAHGGSGFAVRRYPGFVQKLTELMSFTAGIDKLYADRHAKGLESENRTRAHSQRQRVLNILTQFADSKVSNEQLAIQLQAFGRHLRTEAMPVRKVVNADSVALSDLQNRERGLQRRQEDLSVAIQLLNR